MASRKTELRDGKASRNGSFVTGAQVGRRRLYANDAERAKAYRQRKRWAARAQTLSVHFRSQNHAWETPASLFKALDAEFHFDTDVCADAHNAKCAHYFNEETDGLRQAWRGICWMNPPYGADIDRWVQKAFEASLYGATVVCLLPGRLGSRWWRRYVKPLPIEDRRELPGRLRFVNAPNSAPFPSVVVVFRPPKE